MNYLYFDGVKPLDNNEGRKSMLLSVYIGGRKNLVLQKILRVL
jgi:hypothetical protein